MVMPFEMNKWKKKKKGQTFWAKKKSTTRMQKGYVKFKKGMTVKNTKDKMLLREIKARKKNLAVA